MRNASSMALMASIVGLGAARAVAESRQGGRVVHTASGGAQPKLVYEPMRRISHKPPRQGFQHRGSAAAQGRKNARRVARRAKRR